MIEFKSGNIFGKHVNGMSVESFALSVYVIFISDMEYFVIDGIKKNYSIFKAKSEREVLEDIGMSDFSKIRKLSDDEFIEKFSKDIYGKETRKSIVKLFRGGI